jgi:hypothetical protein
MPTNPLWLEHVEKAAWDTVKTLRHELEREQQRVALLTKLQPALPKLLAELEQVAADLGMSAADPVAVVAALRAKLRDGDARIVAAERPQAVPVVFEAQPVSGRPLKNLSAPVRWFARMLERRRRETGEDTERPDPADRDQLVHGLEVRASALRRASPRELFEFAVEIGSLALSLARIARRSEDD